MVNHASLGNSEVVSESLIIIDNVIICFMSHYSFIKQSQTRTFSSFSVLAVVLLKRKSEIQEHGETKTP